VAVIGWLSRALVGVAVSPLRAAHGANTTYYVSRLIPEGALVEVELDAAVDGP
jgi:hypothetical protein